MQNRPRLDDVARYANDMVFLTDAEHRLLDVNDRAAALLGYGREELLRMKAPELRDPATVVDFPDRVREERAQGSALFETRYRRKDGSTFPVEVSVRVFELNGELYHQATARDITDRKRAEEERAGQMEELRRAQEALRASSRPPGPTSATWWTTGRAERAQVRGKIPVLVQLGPIQRATPRRDGQR